MNTREAYDQWASQYDTNENKTRDLEGVALRECLADKTFDRCLEIGCGTGKNTAWLAGRCKQVVAVDLSEKMLALAKARSLPSSVEFVQADINHSWPFASPAFDLVTFSLVLEHIRDLEPIFSKTNAALSSGGFVYIGELHPFKQYQGSKARFDTDAGTQVVPCFNHHISEFIQLAHQQGLSLVDFREYFDEGDDRSTPRILAIVLKKC